MSGHNNGQWTPSSRGAHGHYGLQGDRNYPIMYSSAQGPVYNGLPQQTNYPAVPAPSSQASSTYYMSSNVPSQNTGGQLPGDDGRSSKRVRTTEPGQAQAYPAYAIPPPVPANPSVHPPTDLPPRQYTTTASPYAPPKPPGKITASQMQYLPSVEARLARLEGAVDQYVDLRAQKALQNSILPGSQQGQASQQQKQAPGGQQPGSSSGQK